MASIQFDDASADSLRSDLTKCINEVNNKMDNMGKEVAKIKEWWKGSSEDGFISNFEKNKKKIKTSLTKCADDYKKVVNDVKNIKKNSEKNIKTQLSK